MFHHRNFIQSQKFSETWANLKGQSQVDNLGPRLMDENFSRGRDFGLPLLFNSVSTPIMHELCFVGGGGGGGGLLKFCLETQLKTCPILLLQRF